MSQTLFNNKGTHVR